ncbi:MAG: hypothetical protein AAGC77_05635 [Pseudomonadota bacterium]
MFRKLRTALMVSPVLLAACSTVSQNVEFSAASPDALVLVTGVKLEHIGIGSGLTGGLVSFGDQSGIVFRSFDPVQKQFTSDTFFIDNTGLSSNEIKVEDAEGDALLEKPYYLQKAQEGYYVLTIDIRGAMARSETVSTAASSYHCRKHGYVFPILAGKVNLIDLSNPTPNETEIDEYQDDFSKIMPQYPNITADLNMPTPIGFVEFYGDDSARIATRDFETCPAGVSGYTNDMAKAAEISSRDDSVIIIYE